MTYVGPIDLGDTLSAMMLTDASGVPTDADAAPTYKIHEYDNSASLVNGTTAAVTNTTGTYTTSHAITSGNGFAAGKTYTIRYQYDISASARAQTQTFKVS